MKKQTRISPDIREQIINRIKNEGVSIKQAAEDHGITERAIYNWLNKGVGGVPTALDYAKLKKENQALKEMLGEVSLLLKRAQKNN